MTDQRTRHVGARYEAKIDTWEAWRAKVKDDPRRTCCDEVVTIQEPDGEATFQWILAQT